MTITNQKLGVVIAAYVLGLGVLVGGFFGWRAFAQSDLQHVYLCRVLPWKRVAIVGSGSVTCRELLAKRSFMETYWNSEPVKKSGKSLKIDLGVEYHIVKELMNEVAVKQIGDERKLALLDQDVDSAFTELASASTTQTQTVSEQLKEIGWSEGDFKKFILRPSMLAQKVMTTLTASSTKEQATALDTLINARLSQEDAKVLLSYPDSVKNQ